MKTPLALKPNNASETARKAKWYQVITENSRVIPSSTSRMAADTHEIPNKVDRPTAPSSLLAIGRRFYSSQGWLQRLCGEARHRFVRPSQTRVDAPRMSPLKLILTVLYMLMWPALLLFLAGDWHWRQGWIFGGWFLAVCASTMAWLYRKDPALLAERYRMPGSGGQSRRDKIIVFL